MSLNALWFGEENNVMTVKIVRNEKIGRVKGTT
jgi:hypothetical protein